MLTQAVRIVTSNYSPGDEINKELKKNEVIQFELCSQRKYCLSRRKTALLGRLADDARVELKVSGPAFLRSFIYLTTAILR